MDVKIGAECGIFTQPVGHLERHPTERDEYTIFYKLNKNIARKPNNSSDLFGFLAMFFVQKTKKVKTKTSLPLFFWREKKRQKNNGKFQKKSKQKQQF